MSRAPRVPPGTRGSQEVLHPLRAFAAATMRMDGIDPVTTELVRLHCAGYHDCHT